MSRTASSNRTRLRPPTEPTLEALAQVQATYTDRLVVDAFAILASGGTVAAAKSAITAGRGDISLP